MAERKLFGTDGVRGIANQHPMTCETALALGRAVAHQAQHGPHRHKVVIGKDTRLSCYMLEMAFASGVCSMGVDALLLGPMPTPAVAFITRNMRADAGVVISASHNPYHDNGIKIFARDGFKLPDEREAELEQYLEDEEVGKIRPTREQVGKAFRIDDAGGRYVVALKSVLPDDLDLSGMRIAIDCAHGAAYKVAPMALEELGAEIFQLGVSPNGRNINDRCGALYPEHVASLVRDKGCALGLALDGDADRLMVVDENGDLVPGDVLLGLTAEDMLSQGTLRHKTLVATIMSNIGLDRHIEALGGQVIRTTVGDRYVVEAMRAGGYNLGGENSGHVIHLDHSTTGDGMVTALSLLTTMRRRGCSLSQLSNSLRLFPQALVSVAVTTKTPLQQLPEVQREIEAAQSQLGSQGRVMVRYSGTENKVRVLVEGPEQAAADAYASTISSSIQAACGGTT